MTHPTDLPSSVHPSQYLKLEMDSREENLNSLAVAMNLTEEELQGVVEGELPFTPEMADLLEKHWGISGFLLLEHQKDLNHQDEDTP